MDDETRAFVKLVEQMRMVQDEFFSVKHRRPDSVVRAKQLEKAVDAMVKALLYPNQTPPLFPEDTDA